MPNPLGRQQHLVLVNLIESQFPKLRPGQKRYIQNKVSQVLSRCAMSNVPYRLQSTQWSMVNGEIDHSFGVGKVTVYFALEAD